MADKRISELSPASAVAGADITMIVQGGVNKKVTFANIFNKINTPVHVNQAQTDQDTRISGVNDANLVYVDASADRIGFGTNTPIDKIDINGGLNFDGIVSNESYNTQTTAGAVSILTDTTIIDSLADISVTLPASTRNGQMKTIIATSSGVVTLTSTAFFGLTSITFNSSGDSVVLKNIANKWYVISGYGVVIA